VLADRRASLRNSFSLPSTASSSDTSSRATYWLVAFGRLLILETSGFGLRSATMLQKVCGEWQKMLVPRRIHVSDSQGPHRGQLRGRWRCNILCPSCFFFHPPALFFALNITQPCIFSGKASKATLNLTTNVSLRFTGLASWNRNFSKWHAGGLRATCLLTTSRPVRLPVHYQRPFSNLSPVRPKYDACHQYPRPQT
jgi:hypothetical protein